MKCILLTLVVAFAAFCALSVRDAGAAHLAQANCRGRGGPGGGGSNDTAASLVAKNHRIRNFARAASNLQQSADMPTDMPSPSGMPSPPSGPPPQGGPPPRRPNLKSLSG